MEIVQKFEEEVLIDFFKSYEIPESASDVVINDIKSRLYSLLDIWENVEDRRAILTLGLEEAVHYEPLNAPIEIKAFVVVGVRNSEFENLVSTSQAAKKFGFNEKPMPEKSVKELTMKAIEFFSTVDLNNQTSDFKVEKNNYKNLLEKYPMAATALRHLGTWSNRGISYPKVEIDEENKRELIDFSNIQQNYNPKMVEVVESGMEPGFDKVLLEQLKPLVEEEQQIFYTDSFKATTRNIEKLFIILEYVLDNDGVFVTNNFLITNGYVAKRKELLKPMHTHRDTIENLNNTNGLTKTHLKYVKFIKSQLYG